MELILDWLYKNLFSLIVLIVTPFLSYILSRRKEVSVIRQLDVESDSKTVESSGKVISYWEKITNKQDVRIKDLLDDLNERVNKLERCEEEKKMLELRIKDLIIMNEKLTDYNNRLLNALKLTLLEVNKNNPDLFFKVQEIILGFPELNLSK